MCPLRAVLVLLPLTLGTARRNWNGRPDLVGKIEFGGLDPLLEVRISMVLVCHQEPTQL